MVLIYIYITLGSDTVFEGVAFGRSGSSILMVSAIFNNEFLVGYPYSLKKYVVEGGARRSVMISFTYFLKSFNLTSVKGYSWVMKVTVSQLHTWLVCG